MVDDGSGRFTGYGSTWEVDSYRTRMVPGCFDRWLRELRERNESLVVLSMHETEEPIGTIPASAIVVDEKGLRFDDGQLLVGKSVPEADRIRDLAIAGALKGLSLGFEVRKSEPSKAPGCLRDFLDVEVWEVSFVVWPSNKGAKITSVRAEGEGEKRSMYDQVKLSGVHEALLNAMYWQSWRGLGAPGDADPEVVTRQAPWMNTRSGRSGDAAPESRAGARLSSSTRDGLETAMNHAARAVEGIQGVLNDERSAETPDPAGDPAPSGLLSRELGALTDRFGPMAVKVLAAGTDTAG